MRQVNCIMNMCISVKDLILINLIYPKLGNKISFKQVILFEEDMRLN